MDVLRAAVVLGILSVALASAASTYLQVQGPISQTIYSNGTVYLGKVAPGQSFYVLANASTVNTTGYYVNIGWDRLVAVRLPSGWSSQESPLYENPMKMKVTVPANATDGNYTIGIEAVNVQNYSRLGSLAFNATITVTPDVFDVKVSPTTVYSVIEAPEVLNVTINNTGISDDPFIISALGLPAWNVSDQVISLHSKATSFSYPIFINEPGAYTFNLTVGSSTSALVAKSYRITSYVSESLLYDYKSVDHGAVLSPVVLEPVYAFMSLLSYIYSAITSG